MEKTWATRNRLACGAWGHANGFNALTYRRALAPLGPSLRVVALDLRGHGLTRAPADPAR